MTSGFYQMSHSEAWQRLRHRLGGCVAAPMEVPEPEVTSELSVVVECFLKFLGEQLKKEISSFL